MDDAAQDPTLKPTSTLSQEIKELEKKEPPNEYQAMYWQGGTFKERLESVAAGFKEREVTTVEEIPTTPELEPEVEGCIERVEKDPELLKKLADDYVKTVGMQAANPQNPKVQIPLTDDQIKQGLHHKVWEAIRWLAEWCVRQMKILHQKLV